MMMPTSGFITALYRTMCAARETALWPARRPRAAGDVARRADRLPQSLRQLQRLELRLAQAHQRLAQVLGGVSRALARALAGRSRGLVGIFAVVRCGGHGRLVAALTAA